MDTQRRLAANRAIRLSAVFIVNSSLVNEQCRDGGHAYACVVGWTPVSSWSLSPALSQVPVRADSSTATHVLVQGRCKTFGSPCMDAIEKGSSMKTADRTRLAVPVIYPMRD